MDASVARHCAELDRCNQRGRRMLSILDLLDAATLDLDVAALLMSFITRGASFMVGARPGGAGKTTAMCALLNLIPRASELVAATSACVRAASRSGDLAGRCYVCHEIGSGPYFAYLWGADLRAYCALSQYGAMLATNLHADDLEEARDQVCVGNRVPIEHFNAFRVLVFLRVQNSRFDARRRIEKVYVSDGVAPHALVFHYGTGIDGSVLAEAGPHDRAWTAQCRAFLAERLTHPDRTIEQVREAVMRFLQTHAMDSCR